MSAPTSTDEGVARVAQLPRIDEHAVTIDAGVDDVWRALNEAVDASFGRAAAGVYARLVRCRDDSSSGPRPFTAGATVPGFRVVAVEQHATLVLDGRHRFSSYALTFRLDALGPARTRLRAESRAKFPDRLGAIYRLLVIGTGVHVIAVRRLLSSVQHRVREHRAAGPVG